MRQNCTCGGGGGARVGRGISEHFRGMQIKRSHEIGSVCASSKISSRLSAADEFEESRVPLQSLAACRVDPAKAHQTSTGAGAAPSAAPCGPALLDQVALAVLAREGLNIQCSSAWNMLGTCLGNPLKIVQQLRRGEVGLFQSELPEVEAGRS